MTRSLLIFLFSLSAFLPLTAQKKLDSLQQCAGNAALADSLRVEALASLADYYRDGDLSRALDYSTKALALAQKSRDPHSLMRAGDIHSTNLKMSGRYDEADTLYRKALSIAQKENDSLFTALIYAHLGSLYQARQQNQMAVLYLLKAIQIDEKLPNSENRVAASLNNLGNIYYLDKNLAKALLFYNRALAINDSMHFTKWQAINHLNIGNCYVDLHEPEKAVANYREGVAFGKKAKVNWVIAAAYQGMGQALCELNRFKEAEAVLDSGMYFAVKGKNTELVMYVHGTRADALLGEKRFAEAEKEWKIAHDSAQFYHFTLLEADMMELGGKLFSQTGDHARAASLYKAYIDSGDSLHIEQNERMYADFEARLKQEKLDQQLELERKRKAEIREEALERSRITAYFLSVIVLLSVIAGLIAFRGYRQKKKSHEAISRQKEIIEEKNKDITDSITYARRLQNAILPPEKFWKENLPDSFILYKPKDIVAGDFYWMERVGDKVLFAAADCTGHGVPGAMVSVVCSNALNRAVKESGLTDPGEILGKVRELVIATFEKSESAVADGMDISLCCFDKKTMQLTWAGAYNPLWLVQQDTIKTFTPDKQPIGKTEQPSPFTTHSVTLAPGDLLYLFSDGYADQFGGTKGKKFKYKPLQELLLSIREEPMARQKEKLDEAFESWRGNLEQVDDVCIVGVRIV